MRCTIVCHRHTEDDWPRVMWWRLPPVRCRVWKGEVRGPNPAGRRIRRKSRQTDWHQPVQTETCSWGRTWSSWVQVPLNRKCVRDGEWVHWRPTCRKPLIDRGGSRDYGISYQRRSRYRSGAGGGPSLWNGLCDRQTGCCWNSESCWRERWYSEEIAFQGFSKCYSGSISIYFH